MKDQSAEATRDRLIDHLAETERKAWESLARYKFQMFGYHAAIWIHLNRVAGLGLPNPFKELVEFSRERPLVQFNTTIKTPKP